MLPREHTQQRAPTHHVRAHNGQSTRALGACPVHTCCSRSGTLSPVRSSARRHYAYSTLVLRESFISSL
ncbi:hypothetical protein C8Q76DRAFT_704348 [Earliella scabrosa]|nr:hypothetical protein C8Q76DRAFT_704348 [Earliella scabrosa]